MTWNRYCSHTLAFEDAGFAIDVSRVEFPADFYDAQRPKMAKAFADMAALEKGAIANPDENRMVGHYWLRAPKLAPTPSIAQEIEDTIAAIKSFAADVHTGKIRGQDGAFENLLCIGIGGSALGPQFVAQALGSPKADKLRVFFFDNTDPDGMDLVLEQLDGQLGRTLTVVTSKSGGTPEPRNGMLEAQAAYAKAGLTFAKHAVATTGAGSHLDKTAQAEGFLARFPMWDWVGGRTSELGPVGLLPAALQGIDIDGILAGAAQMDALTRVAVLEKNPAAVLALMWYFVTGGRGLKDMVILPYKDRLLLLSRYLQQLIMESLGKEKDLDGNVVHQGIAVYGNKGSTDQHAYVQQLRDGVNNFFVTFIEVLKDRAGDSMAVEPNVTAGDYLEGFLLGTRQALSESGRANITLTVSEVSPRAVGQLIALFERAVGLYASLININAYHQPGVEAGKKAAAGVLKLQAQILERLRCSPGQSFTAEALAADLKLEQQTELVFKLLNHLSANPDKQVRRQGSSAFWKATFSSL